VWHELNPNTIPEIQEDELGSMHFPIGTPARPESEIVGMMTPSTKLRPATIGVQTPRHVHHHKVYVYPSSNQAGLTTEQIAQYDTVIRVNRTIGLQPLFYASIKSNYTPICIFRIYDKYCSICSIR